MALPPKPKASFLSRVPLRTFLWAAGAAGALFLTVGIIEAFRDRRCIERMDRDMAQLIEREKKLQQKE